MAQNLRDRLRQIREIKQAAVNPAREKDVPPCPEALPAGSGGAQAGFPRFEQWEEAGFQTLKRDFFSNAPVFPKAFPEALPVLIPDLSGSLPVGALPVGFLPGGCLPEPEDLLFFDLETTGLSGGAGTVAFLAAFGRLISANGSGTSGSGTNGSGAEGACLLRVTQYLLLDYPGESDFLQALSGEFAGDKTVIVSYNGKSFDSQILKTRCLMNGMRPPVYRHADLLHPCRRLWKRILPNCSQGTIETEILRLDRSGDTPGSLAPEIWFSFLKTGEPSALMEICGHNRRDIAGLAAIFAAISRIAADPQGVLEKYPFDVERLALRWHDFTRSRDYAGPESLKAAGENLLRFAAARDCPGAALVYALSLLRGKDNNREGWKRLSAITESDCAVSIRVSALRSLAVHSERRLADPALALKLVLRGLELLPPEHPRRTEFEQRAERLDRKIRNLIEKKSMKGGA